MDWNMVHLGYSFGMTALAISGWYLVYRKLKKLDDVYAEKRQAEDAARTVLIGKAGLQERYDDAQTRIEELELSLKEGYGIQARVEVKEVKLDYSPEERVILIKAMEDLIASEKTPSVLKAYIDLFDRMFKTFVEADEVEAKNLDKEDKTKGPKNESNN